MSHALKRTSPKGGPFIGTCAKCGVRDIPLDRMREECANPAGVSDDTTLLWALKGGNA